MTSNSEDNWQQELQFRLDLLRLAAAVDQRKPEELEQAEAMAAASLRARSTSNEERL